MSSVEDFQQRVAAATAASGHRKMPEWDVTVRYQAVPVGGISKLATVSYQLLAETDEAAFDQGVARAQARADVLHVEGGTAIERKVQTPRWFVGEKDHTWSWNEDGRMEVKCRFVADVDNEKLVAAQVWDYKSWSDASPDQNDDLAKSLFVESKVCVDPRAFNLVGIDRLPTWAAGAAGDQQLPPYEDDEVIALDRDGCVVQWSRESDMPVNSGESLDEFGLHNLREHEIARVDVAREAWESAVAEQPARLPQSGPKGLSKTADALEACDWSEVSIGNKAVIAQAVKELRSAAHLEQINASVYRPERAHRPKDLNGVSVFLSLAEATERYPDVPRDAWRAISITNIGPVELLDITSNQLDAAARPIETERKLSQTAAPAVAETITIQEAWEAAGGNPGIKATREELVTALRQLDDVCDESDRHDMGSRAAPSPRM